MATVTNRSILLVAAVVVVVRIERGAGKSLAADTMRSAKVHSADLTMDNGPLL